MNPIEWSPSRSATERGVLGGGTIEPVLHVGALCLSDLQEIDLQKVKKDLNTCQFVEGCLANNVLLTGACGTCKSSLIRACLYEYADRDLRLIEIDKTELVDLPDIVDLVAYRTDQFIVFCDELSFEDGEPVYKALKSSLDSWLRR